MHDSTVVFFDGLRNRDSTVVSWVVLVTAMHCSILGGLTN